MFETPLTKLDVLFSQDLPVPSPPLKDPHPRCPDLRSEPSSPHAQAIRTVLNPLLEEFRNLWALLPTFINGI